VTGERPARYREVRCPGCGQKVFILPRSPFDLASAAHLPLPARRSVRRSRAIVWRLTALGILGSLAGMTTLFFVLRPHLTRQRSATVAESFSPGREVRKRLTVGRRALEEGHFRVAHRELSAALQQADMDGDLAAEERQQLARLHRQSDLLAHLLQVSLQEIVQHGTRVRDEQEWEAQFGDYRGRAVLFDDMVRWDGRQPELRFYEVRVEGKKVRLALEDLALMRQLRDRGRLDLPQRLLFGARLADCGREEGGGWVIRFEPDSGVLLTDEEAAAGCCPAPLGDDLREVLARQKEWLQKDASRSSLSPGRSAPGPGKIAAD
jgi:DNA-directed RNA polymerase subunit RPC12/RpoP